MGIVRVFVFFCAVLFIGLIYVAFYNNDEWQKNISMRTESEKNYLEALHVLDMIEKQLKDADYAAIIYPTASKSIPNSWFHRVIMDNPPDIPVAL